MIKFSAVGDARSWIPIPELVAIALAGAACLLTPPEPISYVPATDDLAPMRPAPMYGTTERPDADLGVRPVLTESGPALTIRSGTTIDIQNVEWKMPTSLRIPCSHEHGCFLFMPEGRVHILKQGDVFDLKAIDWLSPDQR